MGAQIVRGSPVSLGSLSTPTSADPTARTYAVRLLNHDVGNERVALDPPEDFASLLGQGLDGSGLPDLMLAK